MSDIDREIASQPETWRTAAARLSGAGGLPAMGERVAVSGCGTSLYIAQAFAALREAQGRGESDAWPASEMPEGRRYDRTLAISRSGTTTEVERLVARVPATVISAVPDSAAVRSARSAIVLDFADERSIVQTRFATGALALLRAHLGADVPRLAAHAEEALSSELPATPDGFSHFVFLSRGWSVGLANEAALKLREAAAAWAESYPAFEYRHGPISVAGANTLVWFLGGVDPDLAGEVRATGATVVGGGSDAMVELVMIQRFAVALARARGLDPDRPRGLNRSVILS